MTHGDITHVEIPVTDLKSAADFYSQLFGWQIAEMPGYEGYPMWQAPNKISGGALTPRQEGFDQPLSVVEVDSIDEVLTKAIRFGGNVLTPKTPIDETSSYAVFADTDGNQIGLYENALAKVE